MLIIKEKKFPLYISAIIVDLLCPILLGIFSMLAVGMGRAFLVGVCTSEKTALFC